MNKVMLIGNVGADPEVRYYDADQAVAKVSLATTEKGYVMPNGTRVPDRTDWHKLVFYRRLAKVVESYVHKGDKLYVEGRMQYNTYDDRKGVQHRVTEIVVDSMELLTPRSQMAQAPATPNGGFQPSQPVQSFQPVQPSQSAQAARMDNDIPAAPTDVIEPF